MDLSPTDAKLVSIDLYKTDEKYNFKLTDILRKRQRLLLLIINEKGELVFSSMPDDVPDNKLSMRAITPRVMEQALVEAKRLFHSEQYPVATVIKQVIVNKPGERCALVVLDKQFCCLRLFRLERHQHDECQMFAVLIEPIGDPETDSVDLNKVKGLFRLSKREADVVQALMSGDTDKEIARSLGVATETVRAYLKSVRAKLGVNTRTAIVSLVHGFRAEDFSSKL